MEKRSRQGPFRPGPGGLPPYLAGRESEQALCLALLGDLQDGLAPPREVVLHGPRGNGKTALLAWLQQEAAAYPEIDVLRLTPADRDLPFLLVLAGTPGLPSHLNTMNASFWNRAERRPIGHLDSEATAAAIREPLEGERITIDQDALEHVVRASHGYPYFVQVWGQALWRQVAGTAAPKAGRRLTRAEAAAARTDFERERNNYYLDRYEELENLRLLPVARAVADAFGAQPLLEDAEIEAAVLTGLRTSGGTDGMTEARDAIRDLGYVWRSEATPAWEPGIPSLMDYVRTYVHSHRLHLVTATERAA